MPSFDDRIFKVVLSYGTTSTVIDGDFHIHASGQKFANAMQDECTVQISNLKRDTRDQLATQLTPFNYDQVRKSIQLYAGRASTGLSLLYTGDIVECTSSQPPNIILTIKSKTCQFWKYDILAQSKNVTAPMSQISSDVAASMGLTLRFDATDRSISNYSYTGPVIKQIEKLSAFGGLDVFIDGNTLVVKNRGTPLANTTHLLSADSGMVGTPELTEYGVRVRSLLAPSAQIGGKLALFSELNPLLNGEYTIYKMGFEIASRDTPFYTILEASKFPVLYLNLPQ